MQDNTRLLKALQVTHFMRERQL